MTHPNPKPGNIKYLSEGRAKNVAAMMRAFGLKATYKELYKGLGADNMPKARHASVIVTWTKTN
jgi:flagellar motor protein MotB